MKKAISLIVGLFAVSTIGVQSAWADPIETCVPVPVTVGTINVVGQQIPGVSDVKVCARSLTGATGEPQLRRYEGCGQNCLAVVIRNLAVAVDATVSVEFSLDGKPQQPIPVTTGSTTLAPLDGIHNCVLSYHDPGTPDPCKDGVSTPANLKATPGRARVTLQWGRSFAFGESTVAGYEIARSTSGLEGTFTPIGTSTTLNFTDPGLTAGATYWYTVTAFDSQGARSGASAPASATVK
ncbi:MAG: hypothetical protein QOG16_1291 [Actinomycetota bacterium]|jgi:hypothetical protein|nr:hypothetical protein [Actinomycetota bacterium]